jgi:hypothetical protein
MHPEAKFLLSHARFWMIVASDTCPKYRIETMKKLVIAATMMAFASTSAFAGGVGGVAVEPEVVVPVVAGSSLGGAGLIGAGLAAVAIIALVADDSTTATTTGSLNQ